MKTIDILNKQFTVLPSVDGLVHHQGVIDYTQTNKSLKWILNLGKIYKDQINILRTMEYHSKEQKDFKLKFPCWFVGGTFPVNKTYDKEIIEYSNLLAIDIDKQDNPDIDIEKIKNTLFNLPYVIMVSKSISGKGIYVLILVEDGKNTKEYYKYIADLWHNLYHINIDAHCNNIGRKRFLSYDDELLIKGDDVDIEPWNVKTINYENPVTTNKSKLFNYKPKKQENNDLVHKAIWYLLNRGFSIDDFKTTNGYSVWYHVGCDFRHFEDGEKMFITFSNNSKLYNDNIKDITKKWNQTKIENTMEEVSKKWCGICKNKYGRKWYIDK